MSEDDWKKARDKPRDASGRYVGKDVDPKDTISQCFESSSPLKTIKEGPDDFLDKPLLSFSINNPFKKILQWLKDIRKKQTTTFDFKLKIPLIALPIFLIILGSAFQYFINAGADSKNDGSKVISLTPTPTIEPSIIPKPVLMSRFGVVKATYQIENIIRRNSATNESLSTENNITESTPSSDIIFTPTPTQVLPSRYVLLEKNDEVTFLVTKPPIILSKFVNLNVLVTGLYDKDKSTLVIEKVEDIEILR